MLKIKDNVDLKELEKFGFRPKYNEDNGELNGYFFINTKETGLPRGWGIDIRKIEKTRKLKIRHTFKRDKFGFPNVKENKIWTIDNYNNYYFTDFDKLYDLIQAGLVEKI